MPTLENSTVLEVCLSADEIELQAKDKFMVKSLKNK